jgi:dipeptidyl aminopeptidase/acylaminoacyl peptidase
MGGEPVNLTAGTGFELPRNAVPLESPLYDISPDGKELTFVADSDPAANETIFDVFTVEVGGHEAMNRTPANRAPDTSPSYSPDGRWLAVAQQRTKGFYGDLRRLMLIDRRGDSTVRSTMRAPCAYTRFRSRQSRGR